MPAWRYHLHRCLQSQELPHWPWWSNHYSMPLHLGESGVLAREKFNRALTPARASRPWLAVSGVLCEATFAAQRFDQVRHEARQFTCGNGHIGIKAAIVLRLTIHHCIQQRNLLEL